MEKCGFPLQDARFLVGRAMSLGPHDVGHACVTTGRRGNSMPTFCRLRGLICPATPTGVSHLPFQSFSLFTVCFKNNNLLEITLNNLN